MEKVLLSKNGISINGKHKVLLCASLFYFRLAKEEWQQRIDSIIDAGYNCIDVYFPWNFHETAPGQWDFSGMKDVDTFLKMATDSGLYIIARPGPYICSEWDGGALPAWVTANTDIRTFNAEYLACVKTWFDKILPIIKKYEITNNAGVILLQLENELDFFDCSNVDGYISTLKDMAKNCSITVPYFCCAGQKGAAEAGGFVSGIVPTYNFYPNSTDNTFDAVMTYYNDVLAKKDLPLLVSETNRDHFLLRRELASGAKLLGAYNQVAGSNFGFTSSVNNWGKPLAFISTLYDFSSLVTTLGEYSSEIDNARIFSKLINALGEKLAAATLSTTEITYKSDFVTLPKLNALNLSGGGLLVNIPNFSEFTGDITLTIGEKSTTVTVMPLSAPFVMFNTDICGVKIDSSNCELIACSAKKLVFSGINHCVVINGKSITCNCNVNGVEIEFVSISKAATYELPNAIRETKNHTTLSVSKVDLVEASPTFTSIKVKDKLNFENLEIWRGYAEYTAKTEKGTKIFVENVSDIVSSYIDGKYDCTRIGSGKCEVYNASAGGTSVFRVEKWGASNFDDSRLPSIRIAAKKGIENIYSIVSETEIGVAKFKIFDEFLTSSINIDDDGFMPLLSVSQWNTTKIPAVCGYSFSACRSLDKLYIRTLSEVENAVYVNGKLVSRGDYEYTDITNYAPINTNITVTVVYRKLNWAVECGKILVYSLKKADVAVAKLTDTMLDNLALPKTLSQCKLPHKLEPGKQYLGSVKLPTAKSCYVTTNLSDCKITFVLNGLTIARMFGKSEIRPEISGGSSTDFYVPGAWLAKGKELKMYVESIGDKPVIESILIKEQNI